MMAPGGIGQLLIGLRKSTGLSRERWRPRRPNLTVIQLQAPGRTENCQIGVFAAYATSRGRALVDRELYLPKSWTEDRDHCHAAKIPDEREFHTKGELAKAMVLRALASPLSIAWVTARLGLRTGRALPPAAGAVRRPAVISLRPSGHQSRRTARRCPVRTKRWLLGRDAMVTR